MATEQKTFTLADLCREHKLDPKYGRRKARANMAKGKDAVKLPPEVKKPAAKNTRYVWVDTKSNREAITNFLLA